MRPHANPRLRAEARGRDGGVREKLAKAIGNDQDRAGADHGGGATATLDWPVPVLPCPYPMMSSLRLRGILPTPVHHRRREGRFGLESSHGTPISGAA